ncbi:tumor necrosis factor alpha-induced 2-like protein [Labeo rohita]|uniref:Tumor necrosis factor alpha-induced 2-like protein n=1 Tax=Labeo rohita TaxID=84645 RepID=A0A498L2B8_LABRO|nr:tumor necrosis factor alpha-induced 2-like protein [Labeo rohita]
MDSKEKITALIVGAIASDRKEKEKKRQGLDENKESEEICEETTGIEGTADEEPKEQCQKQKHLMKIPKNIKMKNILKHKKSSKSEAALTPEKPLEVDLDTIEGIADSPGVSEVACQKHKIKIKLTEKMKILDFKKWQKNPKSPETPPVERDFNGNLEENRLAEAQQQLVEAEERLFSSKEARAEDEEDKLQRDYEIFVLRLRLAIHDSMSEDNQETLKSALTSILKEEAQDRRWAEVAADQRPVWRPRKCRNIHDTSLQNIVEERMKNADEQENKADNLSTSLKKEVCRMGKQVQKDLLRVVRNLRECYPPDFEICRTYAHLYHQAFSTRLQELARSEISCEECLYILSWIVEYYPNDVLKHKELEEHINSSGLGPLLPEEDLKRLEEQYFSYKESEIKKWLFTAFEKEVKKWSDGSEPELLDGYYFSSLAVDVLPLVDGAVKDVNTFLSCESKARSLLNQLDSVLLSYKTRLEELIKRKQENIPKILSATLVNIYQFRDYVQKPEHLFSEDTRTACLSTLADLKNICHKHFLSRIHSELKPLYHKLWTQVWFAGHCEVVEELVKALENNIDSVKELQPVCREELLAELHVNVMVEYVRRMMKRKLRLKDKEQQEAAAEFICHDSNKICSVFAKVGSREEWLCQILPKLSEILKLQDPGSLQLEIVTLARDYPDIRKHQKNSKSHESEADLTTVKGTADLPGNPGKKHEMKASDKLKNVFVMKRQKNSKSCETPSGNLDQSHVEAEEHLFSSTEVASAEDKDCEIFRLRMAIYDSFSEDNQETLKSALTSVLQEKTQDQCWSEAAVDECPIWSPEKCRQIKTLLKIVVEQRMKNANERENRADKLSTSLKREVCRMGKQVQKDLLRVVRNLRECYPPDFDICRTYAQLYHEAFSTRLQELARSKVSSEECLYILSWIVDYYPNDVLKHKELEEHINSSSLGPLLPEEDLKRLEEQYFTYKENEVRKWLFTALEKEVKKWSDGIQPELMDGYYCSNLAVDVLPLVDITVSEVKALLRCENKTWCLLNQLDGFLTSYKKSLEELVKRKQKHIPKTLNANLVDIHQFRDYVQKPEHPFSEDTRTACLSTLADLKNICHTYFLSRIHKELKPLYRKLWTQVWFAGHREVVEELVKALENSIDHFKELKPVCREELLAELHVDVMVEYVRRMMKRKLKLEDKEQQEAAAEFICHNNNKICSVFAKVISLPKKASCQQREELGSISFPIQRTWGAQVTRDPVLRCGKPTPASTKAYQQENFSNCWYSPHRTSKLGQGRACDVLILA